MHPARFQEVERKNEIIILIEVIELFVVRSIFA